MLLTFNWRTLLPNGSYDICDESGKVVFKVRREVTLEQCFKMFNSNGDCVGTIKKKLPALTPRFQIYLGDEASLIGIVSRYYSMSTPDIKIDFDGWHTHGSCADYRYDILDRDDATVAAVARKPNLMTEEFTVDILNPQKKLPALLLILALYSALG